MIDYPINPIRTLYIDVVYKLNPIAYKVKTNNNERLSVHSHVTYFFLDVGSLSFLKHRHGVQSLLRGWLPRVLGNVSVSGI